MQHLIKLYNDNAYETNETKEIDFNSAYRRHKPNERHNSSAKPKRVVLTKEDKALLLNTYKRKVNTALSNNIENIICFLPVQDKYTFTKLKKQTMKAFFNVVIQRLPPSSSTSHRPTAVCEFDVDSVCADPAVRAVKVCV